MTDPIESHRWIHGAPDCARSEDPLIEALALDPDTHVLRISKCYSHEANFIYLLIGGARALLLDTGGAPDDPMDAPTLPLRATVDAILSAHPAARASGFELIVAHTHTHRDHVHEDRQFADRPATRIVGHDLEAVMAFWGLPGWPEGEGTLDLGGRPLTVFPIPGHEARHVAIHDPRTGILITGDLLYPGLLTVRDWPAFRASARRLAAFVRAHPVTRLLGCHIEMSRRPGELYPLGTTWQPEEHPLPLAPEQAFELEALCEELAETPRDATRASFALAILPEALAGDSARGG